MQASILHPSAFRNHISSIASTLYYLTICFIQPCPVPLYVSLPLFSSDVDFTPCPSSRSVLPHFSLSSPKSVTPPLRIFLLMAQILFSRYPIHQSLLLLSVSPTLILLCSFLDAHSFIVLSSLLYFSKSKTKSSSQSLTCDTASSFATSDHRFLRWSASCEGFLRVLSFFSLPHSHSLKSNDDIFKPILHRCRRVSL